MRRIINNIFSTTSHLHLDRAIAAIAPHSCLGCGQLGATLCSACQELSVAPAPSRCFGCSALTDNYQTCRSCRGKYNFHSYIATGQHEGLHKQLIHAMKFDASRQTTCDIAQVLALLIEQSPHLKTCNLIVPVPTISSHVRMRGFDHTKLITVQLSQKIGVPYLQALERKNNTHQVGKSRKVRIEQMKNAVELKGVKSLNGVEIMLIDDIATTGATLSECARVLRDFGAKKVNVVVFASA